MYDDTPSVLMRFSTPPSVAPEKSGNPGPTAAGPPDSDAEPRIWPLKMSLMDTCLFTGAVIRLVTRQSQPLPKRLQDCMPVSVNDVTLRGHRQGRIAIKAAVFHPEAWLDTGS